MVMFQIVATWQRGAFFSRREKDTESVVGEETERRKIVAGEDKHLLKERLNTLASKTRQVIKVLLEQLVRIKSWNG